jgi:hypothetical protein
VTGVAVLAKLESGVKRTWPETIEYVPWLAMVTDVALQFGAVWPVAQRASEAGFRVVRESALSLARTFLSCAVFHGPEVASGKTVGAGITVGV